MMEQNDRKAVQAKLLDSLSSILQGERSQFHKEKYDILEQRIELMKTIAERSEQGKLLKEASKKYESPESVSKHSHAPDP